jgi:hypothetical protein
MARLPKNPDRDFSASPGEDHADIAKLFASRLPELDEFFSGDVRGALGSNRNSARPHRGMRHSVLSGSDLA